MEPKYYDKPWILSFKGAFLIVLGILFMVKLPGTILSLGIFFSFFIGLTGLVLIAGTIALKKKEDRIVEYQPGCFEPAFYPCDHAASGRYRN
jgi:uncharacterized membrane protein HdeD (DUF308 family)